VRPVESTAVLSVARRGVELRLRPFEIVTLRFRAPRAV